MGVEMGGNNRARAEEESRKELKRSFSEEIRIANGCQASNYKRCLTLFRLFCNATPFVVDEEESSSNRLKRATIERPDTCQVNERQLCFRIRPSLVKLGSGRPIEALKHAKPRDLISIVCHFYAAFVVLRYFLIALVQYEHDRLLEDWQPPVRLGANRTQECARAGDIGGSSQLAKIERAEKWLSQLGAIPTSSAGSFALLCTIISVITCFYNLLCLVHFARHEIRLDNLEFVLNPLQERLRTVELVSQITNNIIQTINTRFVSSVSAGRERPKDVPLTSHLAAQMSLSWQRATASIHLMEHVQLFRNIQLSGQVSPANLCANWHRKLVNFYFYTLALVLVIYMENISSSVILIAVLEMRGRVFNRLAGFACAQWHSNGVLIKDRIRLPPLQSFEHLLAYHSFNGTFSNLIWLALSVEAKHNFSGTKVLILLVDIIFVNGLFPLTTAFWVTLFLMGIADKIIWIGQLNDQLCSCIELIRREFHSNLQQQLEGVHLETEREEKDEMNDVTILRERKEIIKSITIVYLNFELFRGQQRRFLKLLHFNLIQVVGVASSLILICYQLSSKIRSGNKLFNVMVATYIILFNNLYLVVSSMMTHRIEILFKNLTRFMVFGNVTALRNSLTMDLWRRQISSFEEMTTSLAPTLFGRRLSYDRLVSLNAYHIAIWLLIVQAK